VSIATKSIELEPQHVGRDPGRGFDGHAADGAERVGNPRPLRSSRKITIGARPHDRGSAPWGDADRHRIGPPEQLDGDRGAAIARDRLDRIERAPVARDAAVRARSPSMYSNANPGTWRRARSRRYAMADSAPQPHLFGRTSSEYFTAVSAIAMFPQKWL